jgi:hypothetical protein
MAGMNYKGETLVDYSFQVPTRGVVLPAVPEEATAAAR